MKKSLIKEISVLSLTTCALLGLASCGDNSEAKTNNAGSGSIVDTNGNNSGKKYDNDKDALVFSTQAVDGVFNPFFASAGTDMSVVGMTQIGMLSNDKEGNVVCGEDQPTVVLDYEIKTDGSGDNQTSTYYFVLKNNVRFSNGSYLTIKDVLFNLYVYLDPGYTGSSTIYSTDIVGLKEYRTQEVDENEQNSFDEKFKIAADQRIECLLEAAENVLDEHKEEQDFDSVKFASYLAEYEDNGDAYSHLVDDYNKALELFKEELENDFNNSKDTYGDITFTSEKKIDGVEELTAAQEKALTPDEKATKIYCVKNDRDEYVNKNFLSTDVEAFLYNEGYIYWDKKEGKLDSSIAGDLSVFKDETIWTREKAIGTVYNSKIPNSIEEVVCYWGTSTELYNSIVNEETEKYYTENSTSRTFKNISGIKYANKEESVTVKGKSYSKPTYNADGSVKDGNEVLSIKIKKIDPKAIWNFSFGVAPMYYYSDEEHINAFDYEENFGVEYYSASFMNNVIKAKSKVGVPVGAGAYCAAKDSGGTNNVTAGDFNSNNIIYFERNDYFVMGAPKIKKVRLQVVPSQQMITSIKNGAVDFDEPNCKPENITELNKSGYRQHKDYETIDTAGYGYVGVNAEKVPSLKVRQAIMHAISVKEIVEYYQDQASPIYRSISKCSWAYDENWTAYYPFIGDEIPELYSYDASGKKTGYAVNPDYAKFVESLKKTKGQKLTSDEQTRFLKQLVEDAGYTLNGSGVYQNNKLNSTLKYTFTIAGSETDHPAYNSLYHTGEILNKIGFQINVTTDANALKKLSTGDLAVWAAAWGSTIDPDMYQVYHMDSKATSVKNWGYPAIIQNNGDKYSEEKKLLIKLSELIDQGRETNDKNTRKQIYSKALDIVMQMAIELPTYQRKDLYLFNSEKIDTSTFTPFGELSSYCGLTNRNWELSLNC